MLSNAIKQELSELIQEFLQDIDDHELPEGEISFLLHIDGRQRHSWANIRNMSEKHIDPPTNLCLNLRLENRHD